MLTLSHKLDSVQFTSFTIFPSVLDTLKQSMSIFQEEPLLFLNQYQKLRSRNTNNYLIPKTEAQTWFLKLKNREGSGLI